MYREFYGFQERPFSKTPDPEYMYFSRSHREALARLHYAVEEREIAVLTGEVGCGKTTLSRRLMDDLGEGYFVVALVAPLFVQGELLTLFARRLGVEEPSTYRTELLEQIGTHLFDYYQRGVCPVLMIDEAQLIPGKDCLDELRLLTNLQLDDVNLFSLVLLGQPELRSRLLSGYFEPFRQRIGVQYHLDPLDFHEVRDYISFRMERAGRVGPLFTDEAVEDIFRYSGGIPRKINNLAASALLVGFGREADQVDSDIIIDVARDFGLDSWDMHVPGKRGVEGKVR